MQPGSKKLLILDLDETLLHASDAPLSVPENFVIGPYFVYLRPHLSEFVRFALENFTVGVWTSSGENYASQITAKIFPEDSLKFVWASDRCTLKFDPETHDYVSLKNLKKLKSEEFGMSDMIVVDDTPQKHSKNFGNLIAVREFQGEADDNELSALMPYLLTLKDVLDVRQVEKRGWRTRNVQHQSPV
jgi:carboxy-terminal domain RNA polymerase II polypeptide A small phosphatase